MIVYGERQKLTLQARLFHGLSDASRLSILNALRDGAKTVSELAAVTGLSQSNTSNHLSCLADCGLVSRVQRGRHVVYQLSDARVDALLVLAEQLLADAALSVYECTRHGEKETVV